MITIQSPIIGNGGTHHEVNITGANRLKDVNDYAFELERLCPLVGFDYRILFAQAWHETAGFTSHWWTERLNCCGLGITGDPVQNEASHTWKTGIESARSQIVHMAAYVYGPSAIVWLELREFQNLDPRLRAVIDAGYAGTVKVLGDLGNGRWATDPKYAEKIAAVANRIFKEDPPVPEQTVVFGRVKHPPFIDRLIPDAQTGAWDNLGPMNPIGVCQHSMVGSLWGTDGWFRRGRGVSTGLTSYGIGNATDGPQWDGVIIRWNDPTGAAHTIFKNGANEYTTAADAGHFAYKVSPNRAGWANGGTDGLEGDGPNFVRRLGISAVNRDLVSIERSDGGNITTPMSAKQFESICQLTAYWFDQAHVPWSTFPLNPALGIVTHMLHLEFATKDCPHPPVYSRINEIQNRIRAILKAAQVQVAVPDPIPPVKPPQPSHDWPNGWTDAQLKQRWHAPVKVSLNGDTTIAKFSPTSELVNAWVARGVSEGFTDVKRLPIPATWYQEKGPDAGMVLSFVTFNGPGMHNWTLYRQAEEASWYWIDQDWLAKAA